VGGWLTIVVNGVVETIDLDVDWIVRVVDGYEVEDETPVDIEGVLDTVDVVVWMVNAVVATDSCEVTRLVIVVGIRVPVVDTIVVGCIVEEVGTVLGWRVLLGDAVGVCESDVVGTVVGCWEGVIVSPNVTVT
jgi:hypothetical protein